MKKFDLVELQNIKKEYLEKNLIKGMHGVIIESNYLKSRVLFFNEQNIGEYALVKIANKDLFLEKIKKCGSQSCIWKILTIKWC